MGVFGLKKIPQDQANVAHDVDPELLNDAEGLPHLKELVQHYSADWVYPDAKYGHYRSIERPRFEPQIFENEESNAEEDCLKEGFSTLQTFTPREPSESSWSGSESRSPQNLEGSLLQAYDPVYSWEAERGVVPGHRFPLPPLTATQSGVRFTVQVQDLIVQAGLAEPIFGTLSLYHRDRREKLSEDVYFSFLPAGWPGAEHNGLRGQRKPCFTVDSPSASICLIVQLERTVTEENGVKPSVYSRKDPPTLTSKEEARLNQWLLLMPYREPLAWTSVPIFDSNVTGGLGGFGTGIAPAHDKGSKLTNGSSKPGPTMEVLVGLPVQVDIPFLHRVKEPYSEELLQDPKRKSEKPFIARLQLLIERLNSGPQQPISPTSSTQSPRAKLPNSRTSWSATSADFKPASLYPASDFSDSDDEGFRDPPSESVPSTGASSPAQSNGQTSPDNLLVKPLSHRLSWSGERPQTSDGKESVNVLDFRMLTRREPHTQLMHTLYVYPQSLYTGKKRNVFVTVELKADDADVSKPGLESIYPKEPGKGLQRSADSLVAARTKTCLFHDEFKIRLPAVLTPQHHLLFTFSHIELEAKDRQPVKPQVVGYSVLPLHVGLQVARSDGSLPVAKELLFNYLQDNVKPHMEYWEEGRPVFRLRIRLCSTIFPVHERLRTFYSHYDTHIQSSSGPAVPGFLEAINGLRGVESAPLLQYLQPTLSMLLRLVGEGGEMLQVAAFRAVVNILTRVQQESSDGSDRNRFLVQFVDYAFVNNRSPVYPGLCSVWRSLARSKAKGYRVGPVYDDVLTMAWVFFELIIKSIALHHGSFEDSELESQAVASSLLAPRSPPNLVTLESDVHQCIRSLIDCLLMEILERSRSGGLALARRLNTSLAYFCQDLLTVVNRQQTYELIQLYFERFVGVLVPVQHELKLTFSRVICDHEDYLLLPGRTPSQPSLLVTSLLREIFIALSHEEKEVKGKAARLLTLMLCKHEYDTRYQQVSDKMLIADLYSPIVTALVDNIEVFHGLGPVEKREVLVGILAILRQVRREHLQVLWHGTPEGTAAVFTFLQEALVYFEYVQYMPKGMITTPLSPIERGTLFPPYSDHLSPSVQSYLALATLNDAKAALESTYVRQTPVERSSLRAQLIQAQHTRKEAAKTLRERLNPRLRQQLEVWEGNLSAWVSLHVLEILQAFSDALVKHPEKVATDTQRLDVLCNLLLTFLARPQAVSVWRVFVPTFGLLFVRHGPIFLAPANAAFLKELCRLLLRLLFFRNIRMRRRAAVCLLLLFRASFAVSYTISKLRILLTLALSELLTEKELLYMHKEAGSPLQAPLLEAEHLKGTLLEMSTPEGAGLLLAECGLAPVVLSTARGEFGEERWKWTEVALLKSTLANIVDSSLLQTRQVVESPSEQLLLAESCYSLAAAFAHVPDLHIFWLLRLSEHHKAHQAWAEAAQCMLTAAGVIVQAAALTPGSIWGPQHVQALKCICPGLPAPVVESEFGGLGGSSLTVEKALDYLQGAWDLFAKAELFHACSQIAELLVRAHQAHKAYTQLVYTHKRLADVYDAIVKQDCAPIPFKDANYYRVGYYGARFGPLHGAQFVHREPRKVRLGDMVEHCTLSAAALLGGDKTAVQIIPDSRDVNPSELLPGKGYLQITSVEPVPAEDDEVAPEAGPSAAQVPTFMGLSRFVYDTPFTEKGPAQGPLEEQWKRRTILVTGGAFPGLLGRLRVVKAWQRDFSPAENAVEMIEQRTVVLREEVEAVEPRLSTLQRLLQGSVAVQVNGGLVGVCVAFLQPGREDGRPGSASMRLLQPESAKLVRSITNFMQTCHKALQLHERLVSEEDREFHGQLLQGFQDLQTEVGQYIPSLLKDTG